MVPLAVTLLNRLPPHSAFGFDLRLSSKNVYIKYCEECCVHTGKRQQHGMVCRVAVAAAAAATSTAITARTVTAAAGIVRACVCISLFQPTFCLLFCFDISLTSPLRIYRVATAWHLCVGTFRPLLSL